MAYLACDKDGREVIFDELPTKLNKNWDPAKFRNGKIIHWISPPPAQSPNSSAEN